MKKTLLNSLLVAVGLLAGTMGAMADTYEILYGTAQQEGETITGVTNQTDFTGDANEQTGVTFSDGNGNAAAMPIDGSVLYLKSAWTKDFSNPVTSGKVYFAGNYTVSSGNSKTINIVDSKGNVIYSSSQNTTGNNGEQIVAYICGTEISNYVRLPRSSAYSVKSLCIDLDLRTVTYDLLVSSTKNNYKELTGSVALPSDIADVKGLSINATTYGAYLDNVLFYSQISEVTKYASVINYKLGDDIVKSTTFNAADGAILTAADIVYDEAGVKYFSTESETPTLTVSATGTNVLDVNVRKAYTATLNVTTTIDGTSTTATTNWIEADDKSTNWSYAYSLYVAKDGVYYIADNTETFGETGTFTDGQVIDKTVTYSNVAKDVVYFSEGESSVGSNITYSNGGTGYVAAQNKRNRGISAGTLSAGTYEFAGVITGTHGRAVVVREKTSDDDAANSEIFATLSSSTQSATFTLENATDVVISGANSGTEKTNQSEDFDYVVIKRVLVDETLAITSAGYATFVPNANVTIPAAVKAYTVKVNDDKATITLGEIAADAVVKGGTAILVEGAEGSYNFAETTATETTLADNDLVAADGTEVANGTQYGLAQVDGKVGFHKIKSGDTLTKGKAYLKVSAENAAKMSFFSLNGGELTAISGVEAAKAANGEFYTLQGVRVAKPSKGLYICNGKKVIVK